MGLWMWVALGALRAHSYQTLWCAPHRHRCACVHNPCLSSMHASHPHIRAAYVRQAERNLSLLSMSGKAGSVSFASCWQSVVRATQSKGMVGQGEACLDRLPGWAGDGLLEREVDWEPGEHLGGVAGRMCAEAYGPIPAAGLQWPHFCTRCQLKKHLDPFQSISATRARCSITCAGKLCAPGARHSARLSQHPAVPFLLRHKQQPAPYQ